MGVSIEMILLSLSPPPFFPVLLLVPRRTPAHATTTAIVQTHYNTISLFFSIFCFSFPPHFQF